MISPSDITIVLQGSIPTVRDANGESFRDLLNRTRSALPGAKVILSTWRNTKVSRTLAIDEVIRSNDPGSLPPIKFDNVGSNNINRQIVSTLAGLKKVHTRYAIKLRTDACLEHDGFLRFFEKYSAAFPTAETRILTNCFFTIDPLVLEHMPFHTGDWFMFSTTERLIQYWSRSPITLEDASYYETHPHAKHSSFLDKQFRTRLAVEQYLCTAFAAKMGYTTPEYHNDIRKEVISAFHEFMAQHFMVLDPWQSGLKLAKYRSVHKSTMQSMNCMMFFDWYKLCADRTSGEIDPMLYEAAAKRARQKQRVKIGNMLLSPIAPIIYSHKFTPIGVRLLKIAMASRKIHAG
jgi:hypothetical protein